MRLYYIFLIKEDVYKITKNSPEKLYHVLQGIYKMNKEEINVGYKIFEKTCNFIDSKNLNSFIRNLNYDNYNYTCYRNTHLINNFYNNEATKLTINSSHMKMKTNIAYPKFFNEIRNFKNVFICDFVNDDYFFLKKINLKEYNYS